MVKMKFLVNAAVATFLGCSCANAELIHDSWYSISAGKTVFGHYHETIEKKDKRYYYRYAMLKKEQGREVLENYGGVAEEDLTPVAFNLVKAGAGATETVDATYQRRPNGGEMTVIVKGARVAEIKRVIPKGAFIDMFLPVYFKQNWNQLTPSKQGNISMFQEDPNTSDFMAITTHYKVVGDDKKLGCKRILIENQFQKADWCMNSKGILIDLLVGDFHVQKVENEAKAKALLK